MKPSTLLNLIIEKYKDKPDDFTLSIGHFESVESIIPGKMLPDFKAAISVTMGDVKKMKRETK